MFVDGGCVSLCGLIFFGFRFTWWLFGYLFLFGDEVVVLTDNLTYSLRTVCNLYIKGIMFQAPGKK